jgi:phage terminase small subunit
VPPPSTPVESIEDESARERERSIAAFVAVLGNGGTLKAAAAAADVTVDEAQRAVMQNDAIVQRIVMAKKAALSLADVTPNRTLLEVARIAYSDARDAFDEGGKLRDPHEWDDDTAATVSSVDQEVRFEGRGDDREMVRIAKIRRHDKMNALNFLGRQQKLIGTEGDGVSELANALADRLNAQRAPPQRLRAPVPLVEVVDTGLSAAELAS